MDIKNMEFSTRKVAVGAAVVIVSVAAGLLIGQMADSGDRSSDLYSESFNVTLTQSSNEATVDFDNRTVELYMESWDEFRAFYDNGLYEERINTTADGEVRTTTSVITVDGGSYNFRFRYRDDPNSTEGDYIRLYRIERIQ